MHTRALFALALGALALPAFGLAQQTAAKAPEPEPTHFKLVYRLLQIGEDGKIANARSYSTIVATTTTGDVSAIRCEDQVPIATRSFSNASNPENTQYRYQDVGTHIDTKDARRFNRQLNLTVSADSSTVVAAANKAGSAPIIRRLAWNSNVVVPLDKPTVIFISDNISDTGKTELEITATEIK